MAPLLIFQLADALARQGGPAESRSAISRAYYAAHHFARDFLAQRVGVEPVRDSQSHSAVLLALQRTGDQIIADAGVELSTLQTLRKNADYKLNDPATEHPAAALAAVNQAFAIISALQTCGRDPQRMPRVKSDILNWVRSLPMATTNLRII